MKVSILVCAIALLLCGQSNGMPEKMVEKWAEKIMKFQFMHKCWGHKTMMNFHKKMKELHEECVQLTPSFEINLFENDQEDFFDEETADEFDPFISGNAVDSQTGFQTLPDLPFRDANGRPINPIEAFAAFFAQAQAQAKANRAKRHTYGKRPSAEEFRAFAKQVSGFKSMMKDNFGNLTCVLAKMGALDSKLDIKLNFYTERMWDMFDPSEQPEYEFKEKVNEGYEMCHQLSQSIPESLLEKKGPMYKQFGRQKMFFKCCHKMEKEMCVKKELHEWIEMMMGEEPPKALRQRLGLPSDKYDASLMAMTVKMKNKSPTEKFIMKFMMDM